MVINPQNESKSFPISLFRDGRGLKLLRNKVVYQICQAETNYRYSDGEEFSYGADAERRGGRICSYHSCSIIMLSGLTVSSVCEWFSIDVYHCIHHYFGSGPVL